MDDPAAQLAAQLQAALKDPRSPEDAATEGTTLYDFAGKPRVVAPIVAREILKAQAENPRAPEDALYESPPAPMEASAEESAAAEPAAELAEPLAGLDPAGTAGADPHFCEFEGCGRSFKSAVGLKRHVTTAHQKE